MVASRSESVTLQTFSSHDFRATVGAFATGVTVVTTRGEEHAYGMTANAFSSVSLDPPLILVCVISGSEGADHITTNGVFAVNVLSAEQEPLSRYFSSRDRPKGRDAFAEGRRIERPGSPILAARHGPQLQAPTGSPRRPTPSSSARCSSSNCSRVTDRSCSTARKFALLQKQSAAG